MVRVYKTHVHKLYKTHVHKLDLGLFHSLFGSRCPSVYGLASKGTRHSQQILPQITYIHHGCVVENMYQIFRPLPTAKKDSAPMDGDTYLGKRGLFAPSSLDTPSAVSSITTLRSILVRLHRRGREC